MAVPAFKFEPEEPVEERIARIETTVEHIQADVSDLKVDVRRLNDKIDDVDQRLTTKIDAVDRKLTDKIDALSKEVMAALAKLDTGRMADRVWQLLILGQAFVILARVFKWI